MFTAEDLVNAAMNEPAAYNSVVFAVKRLRNTLDGVAKRLAKANADWHDDPDAEDYAEHHASAEQQFPRELRDQAIKELVEHYLGELS